MKLWILFALFICNYTVYSATIKVGVLSFAPPFSTKSDTSNHYNGFVIDLMNVMCKRMNLICDYVPIPASGELDGLDKGLYDITFSSLPLTTTTLSKFGKYIYSLPYLPSYGHFVSMKTLDTYNLDELSRKKIGVFKINDFTSPVITKLNDNNSFVEFNEPDELINALTSKNIDLILINHYSAQYIIHITGNTFKIVGDKISIGNGYGIVALKNHSLLINEINQLLVQMEKDGAYLKIFNRYFGKKTISQ